MVKRLSVILALISLAAAVYADDFVQTFNTFYHGTVQLSLQDGQWVLKVNTDQVKSGKILVLDIKNYYIQFSLVSNPLPDDGPVLKTPNPQGDQFTFATYPRQGKSDMVAVSSEDSFGLYEPVSGDRQDISKAVLPPGVFRKFFDAAYLEAHPYDFQEGSTGEINRQTEVEGPDVFTYTLTIPQVGTKTVLNIQGEKSPDSTPMSNDLVGAVNFHHAEMTWDIKRPLQDRQDLLTAFRPRRQRDGAVFTGRPVPSPQGPDRNSLHSAGGAGVENLYMPESWEKREPSPSMDPSFVTRGRKPGHVVHWVTPAYPSRTNRARTAQ